MIKATINEGSTTELKINGKFNTICVEFCAMGRAIGEAFRKKNPVLAEMFNDGLKKMAEDRLFSCSDTEFDELTGDDKKGEDSDCDDLEKAVQRLRDRLEELKKVLEDK